ncbi:hypothetical protein BH23VER1_BH23VER1_18770 [soil metagenome]
MSDFLKLAIAIGAAAAAGPWTALGLDLIYPPEGPPLRGEILYITDDEVRVRALREGVYEGGPGIRTIPLDRVDFIDFEPVPGEAETLDSGTALDLVTLRRLWNELEVHLHRPRSNAGEIALIYANRLLDEGDERSKRDAIPVFERVGKEDWSEARRGEAQVGRLRALMETGDAAAAAGEAEILSAETEDPGMLIEARFILAEASLAELKAIDQENPRWMDDDEVRPVRQELFHQTVDRYLFPYLFHGSEEREAARGLWGAHRAYRYGGNAGEAGRCAEDIAMLYPETTYAELAQKYLSTTHADDPK